MPRHRGEATPVDRPSGRRGAPPHEGPDDAVAAATAWLRRRGAAEVAHLGGDLLTHLEATAGILAGWGVPRPVRLAGLCHAAYGTDGFPHPLTGLDGRGALAGVIGREAEEVVHLYAACDRAVTYPRLAAGTPTVLFRDRFDGTDHEPPPERLRAFALVTLANELELVRSGAVADEASRRAIAELFATLVPYAGALAEEAAAEAAGAPRPTGRATLAGPGGGPLVDYQAAATRYATGRALAGHLLDRWRDAVAAATPGGLPSPAAAGGRGPGRGAGTGPTVVDVGAGTGVFSRAWAAWGAPTVVAVEPSAAMRAEAVAADPAAVAHVAGRAEALPLAAASCDAAWMSAVIHHVSDVPAALAGLRRVVRDGGVVHVRGYAPGRGRVVMLEHMPAAAARRARARFPSAEAITDAFAAAGFRPVAATDVEEPRVATGTEAAEWVGRMHHADTLLGVLTDDELAETQRNLRAVGDDRLPAGALTLLSFA